MRKGEKTLQQKLTEEQRVILAKLLISFGVQEQQSVEILMAIDTQQKVDLFIDKLSERNYEATPEEVYQLSGEAVLEAKYG
jgi:hypothetical protein